MHRADAAAQIMAELDALQDELAAGRMPDLDAADARIAAIASACDDPDVATQARTARASIEMARSVGGGDPGAMAALPADLTAWLDGMPVDNPQVQPIVAMMRTLAELASANARGEDVRSRLDEVQHTVGVLPPGPLRTMVEDMLASMSGLTGPLRGPDGRAAPQPRPAGASPVGGMAALHDTAAALALLQDGTETDPGRVELAIGTLRRALVTAGDTDRTFHLTGLALGLFRRFELTTSVADLREARTLLEEARELAGGPQHPGWGWTNEMLGEVRGLLGDDDPGPSDATAEGLRGLMWQVLVQPDVQLAAVVARGGAADAIAAARRCVAAGDVPGAISALDAGRGLALYAATEFATTADRLDRAGAGELARRWRAALAGDGDITLPAALRREVMAALTRDGAAARLLDPPTVPEIQEALRALDVDALVYLVPRDDTPVGMAVVAPADGPPSYLPLPGLAARDDVDVERYLSALAARDLRDMGEDDDDEDVRDADPDTELVSSLDELCGWAWRAAMGPVLQHTASRLTAPPRRPLRLVLVPMGELGRIPWQAARRPDGVRAVQLVALSSAASARMLCHGAALAPVPTSPTGLIVADPDTANEAPPLLAARWEAYAVRQAFYRGARLVGRRPDGSVSPSGTGTGAQVRRWLADTDLGAGTMLHLACHGFVRAGGRNPSAHLLLADGDTLTAEELVELMARAPGRDVGLVVLAACRTGLSINGYDEAYSLGSAFLAAGARSVLSTHWAVQDESTSALMFMFHRFLRVEGRPVWAALHAAQLWMLDPLHEIPEDMPRALRARLEGADLTGVVDWAAFTHSGQ